jgi:Spy/CpxP family protein refolding chaperone
MNYLTKVIGAFALAALLGTLVLSSGQSRRGGDGNGPSQDGPGRPGHPPGPPDGLDPRMLDQLNLTDQQRQQIKALHETARTDGQQFGEQLKANHDAIEAMVTSGTFDETQARKLLATKFQLMTEMDLIHLRTDTAVYALLTPDQRAQAEQIKQSRPPMPPPFRGDRPVDGK